MNGEPLPLKHGYPLRSLALGWTGANCIKWLTHIMVLDRAFEGFFMDSVYRIFQKGQEPTTGEVVTNMKLKSIITQPTLGETLKAGTVVILGTAYGGQKEVEKIEISLDGGGTWQAAEFIGPRESYAWRQWRMLWEASAPGDYTIMARATDAEGNEQRMHAQWNVLGYGNNGVTEHAVRINIA